MVFKVSLGQRVWGALVEGFDGPKRRAPFCCSEQNEEQFLVNRGYDKIFRCVLSGLTRKDTNAFWHTLIY